MCIHTHTCTRACTHTHTHIHILFVEEFAIHLGNQHVYKQPQHKVESDVSLKNTSKNLQRIVREQHLIPAEGGGGTYKQIGEGGWKHIGAGMLSGCERCC